MRSHALFVRPAVLAGVLVLSAATTHAADINPLLLNQAEFKLLTQDLGSAVSFKPLIPAEALGVTGFDIAISTNVTPLQNNSVWDKAASGSFGPSSLIMPGVRVHKGLPFNIDIGASYAKQLNSHMKVVGGELRWAFVPGGVATPALAVRASVSSLSGVEHLKLRTSGIDVSISKGFAFLTPYVGVGRVRVKSSPDGAGLASETISQSKVFGGLNLNFGLTNLALEADKTGDAPSYGIKFGLRF